MEPNIFFDTVGNSKAFQLFLIVIGVPLFCALCISFFHRFTFAKEFFSICSSIAVVLFNLLLVLFFLEGRSFNVELIEVFPNVGLSFHIEPIGLVFSSNASLLWFVNSIYSIGYLRGKCDTHYCKNRQGYISIKSSLVLLAITS